MQSLDKSDVSSQAKVDSETIEDGGNHFRLPSPRRMLQLREESCKEQRSTLFICNDVMKPVDRLDFLLEHCKQDFDVWKLLVIMGDLLTEAYQSGGLRGKPLHHRTFKATLDGFGSLAVISFVRTGMVKRTKPGRANIGAG